MDDYWLVQVKIFALRVLQPGGAAIILQKGLEIKIKLHFEYKKNIHYP